MVQKLANKLSTGVAIDIVRGLLYNYYIINKVIYPRMNYKVEIEKIKYLLNNGKIGYAEAQKKAAPILDEMNTKAEELAKQFGRKHKKFGFSGIMR